MKFTIGDKARVIDHTGFGFDYGTIVTIKSDVDTCYYVCEGNYKEEIITQAQRKEHLELINQNNKTMKPFNITFKNEQEHKLM